MFSNKYLKACIFIVILQFSFLVLSQIIQYLPIETLKKWLASDYMSEEDEEAMVEKQRKRIEEYRAKSLKENLLQDNDRHKNAGEKNLIRSSA